MKQTYSVRSLIIVSVICLLCSCKSMRQMQEDIYNSRDKDHKSFVLKNDGEIVETNETRLRTPLFGKAAIELDNDVRIPLKEVRAYQNSSAFMMTTPYGFAPRIKKGLINVYLAQTQYSTYDAPTGPNGTGGGWHNHVRYIYYLQKGDEGGLREMTPSLVQDYVRDYAPSMEYIDIYLNTKKKVKMWSIINTAAVFGGAVLAASGSGNNGKASSVSYAGGALFLGGLVNGFVNKVRKVKNARNLEHAIDEYNLQITRKKRR